MNINIAGDVDEIDVLAVEEMKCGEKIRENEKKEKKRQKIEKLWQEYLNERWNRNKIFDSMYRVYLRIDTHMFSPLFSEMRALRAPIRTNL